MNALYKDTMFAVITAGKRVIGKMWVLGRGGVRVEIEDRVYTGFCVSDVICTHVLRGYSDIELVWTN